MLDRKKFIKTTVITAGAILSTGYSYAFESFSIAAKKPELPGADYFLHGVASGDPLESQIIIWTRISGATDPVISVIWIIAGDEACANIIQSGIAKTSSLEDYCIKVDINNLTLKTTYYYRFIYNDIKSPIGKTKTSANDDNELQLAVISCSDFSAGYYNALGNIAKREELDAVVHLGDYIYEGTFRDFDSKNNVDEDEYEATHFNRTREWWLHYYRRRYSLNRLDPDLQAAHKTHPFITIWDDHEISNNAWKDGAQGHNEQRDGDWNIRKGAARQVYAEWMPIRGNAEKIYRTIRFGNLADLILLDTRIEGRDKQVSNTSDPALFLPDRTILGKEQKQWLFAQLNNSSSRWKLLGSQVIFSQIDVKWANIGGHFADKVSVLESTLLDYWEGYPVERDTVINHISANKINNVIIMSASMHCALAFNVTARATKFSRKGENATYDSSTGKGSVAVEFAAPSITSANFDEKMDKFYANTFQSMINKKLPLPLNYNPNPNLKFADLQRHGYYILKLTADKAESSFYFTDELQKRTSAEKLAAVLFTKSGQNMLQNANIGNHNNFLL